MQPTSNELRDAIFLVLLQTHGRVALDEVQVNLVAEELTDVADGVPMGPVS